MSAFTEFTSQLDKDIVSIKDLDQEVVKEEVEEAEEVQGLQEAQGAAEVYGVQEIKQVKDEEDGGANNEAVLQSIELPAGGIKRKAEEFEADDDGASFDRFESFGPHVKRYREESIIPSFERASRPRRRARSRSPDVKMMAGRIKRQVLELYEAAERIEEELDDLVQLKIEQFNKFLVRANKRKAGLEIVKEATVDAMETAEKFL